MYGICERDVVSLSGAEIFQYQETWYLGTEAGMKCRDIYTQSSCEYGHEFYSCNQPECEASREADACLNSVANKVNRTN